MPMQTKVFPFNAQIIGLVPDAEGVYMLFSGNEIIYYGRAIGTGVTIRNRLQAHLNGNSGRCTQQASHFGFEICANGAAREVYLLQEYRAAFGRLPRCNERVG